MWEGSVDQQEVKSWPSINAQFQKDYPNILALVDLLLCISPSSADVERGFTQLKLIKTDRRNTLSGTTLNKLLAVRLLTPPIKEYNPRGKSHVLIHLLIMTGQY